LGGAHGEESWLAAARYRAGLRNFTANVTFQDGLH
jgi:hypothetical protein